MSAPKRIQRKRTRGWRMPEGTVYVGRPARWNNPFPVDEYGRELSLQLFGQIATGCWSPGLLRHLDDAAYDRAYLAQSEWKKRIAGHPLEAIWLELRGRDLACWCPLDQPCHADVLIELANGTDA